MSLEHALTINIPFLKAPSMYRNRYPNHVRPVASRLQHHGPNLTPSQHDIIRAMILNKKLKIYEIVNVAECSEPSIKAILSNLISSALQMPFQIVAEGLGLLRLPT
jgi:hypothetical protein